MKARWFLLVLWAIILGLLLVYAPPMDELVRDKGQISVPEGYRSSIADQILAESSDGKNTSTVAVVFHEKQSLTTEQISDIKSTIQELNDKKVDLSISEITTHFNNEELRDQLVSENGQTVLALLTIPLNGDLEIGKIRRDLQETLESISSTNFYMTSGAFIDEDVVVSSQEGLQKTEIITIVFILAVLILVFRSIVTPLIPLVTVGVTYVSSQAVVAFMVDIFNFPLSNFTQIFLVAILFGIGTDYCILLLSRFKEELSHGHSVHDAVQITYKTAGRTVFFSGLAVLIGFASIGFATFKLYQSASAVAIGVAVLLLALWTIVPFFMVTLGKYVFWPSKGSLQHKQSVLWGAAGSFSFKRPLVSLLLVAAIILPALVMYDGSLSFNALDEMGDDYDSVKAFSIISESFGPGESLPAKIVIKYDKSMDHESFMPIFENISREVAALPSVAKVRSITRPLGEEIQEFYVSHQAEQLGEGLGQGTDGVDQISSGLLEASESLTESKPQLEDATNGIDQLVLGTNELKQGVGELQNGLIQINNGLREGSVGIDELKKGLDEALNSATLLTENSGNLYNGYVQLENGLKQLSPSYQRIQSLVGIQEDKLEETSVLFSNIERNYDIENDEDFNILKELVAGVQSHLVSINLDLIELNRNLLGIQTNLLGVNAGFAQIVQGHSQVNGGLQEILFGINELQKGLDQAATGQQKVINELPGVSSGLSKVGDGQREVGEGVQALIDQLGVLSMGLSDGASGLEEVSGGLGSAIEYLGELGKSPDKEITGWYMPEEVLESEDFAQVLDTYLSNDRKVATFDVILSSNPYSNEALEQMDLIESAVKRAISGTPLENSRIGISGVTSTYADLNNISKADYSRTVIFMLIGIGIVLIILLRSLIMPIYLLASLVLTYFTASGINEIIFVNILGYPGISWAVPFFGFVILMALGVDYSIFLMDRFNEYKELTVKDAMIEAMKNMGTVIFSAAIILAGTFAAMYPSGVLSLLQIATLVLSGLILYALVFLPFFVPVMVKVFGKGNWWPFNRQAHLETTKELDM